MSRGMFGSSGSISTLICLLFPTCQNLRPTEFSRDNFLTGVVQRLYVLDTSTNVCPSEHVICAVAAFSSGIAAGS